ncbi:exodeoxyribonuclease III [Catenulispora yoronensis]|uniref:Exodeoxyribonuclease III n=1 Tax=Catenulispora yoronensis TaxID=450799 RepID=A0ABN2ULZ5_9ACTN
MLTVSTVNVNGIRAAAAKGFTEWLAATPADVVCLQEVRAEPEQFPGHLRAPDGWHTLIAPASTKGRAGVAVFSRIAPTATRIGFDAPEFAASGRYAEIDLPNVTIASLYLPAGEAGTDRQSEKERFMTAFHAHLQRLHARAATTGREVLICGDWNIAHREADIKNWKANQKNSGFLPEERQWLSTLLDDTGYVDVVRTLHPNIEGPYSWWSFRGKAFDNDSGWRIDYHMATPDLAARATSAVTERAATYAERWSDHAPVTCVFDWDIAAVPAPRGPIVDVSTGVAAN